MHSDRLKLLEELQRRRGSKVLVYFMGDRPGLETRIPPEAMDQVVPHMEQLGKAPRITLLLHTKGGDIIAAWSIVQLLRGFCDELEVIVPAKARSSGTLICLGADRIVMTRTATLGPIDPTIDGPLNPVVAGNPQVHAPVSVEAVNGYVEFAREIAAEAGVAAALQHLSTQVHPLVLGNVYRSRKQMRMLARRLVSRQVKSEETVEKILNFLCSESGSHDYTIFATEARDGLGLPVELPTDECERVIRDIYRDVAAELELTTPYDARAVLGNQPSVSYAFRRAVVESQNGGLHVYASEGTLSKVTEPNPAGTPQAAIHDERTFEGWRHEL
jgi:hypothetical protein